MSKKLRYKSKFYQLFALNPYYIYHSDGLYALDDKTYTLHGFLAR